MLMSAAVETASNPTWLTLAVGVGGAALGALATSAVEVFRRAEARRRRWDDEIIETAIHIIDEADHLAHLAETSHDHYLPQGERREHMKQLHDKLGVKVSRLELIAPESLCLEASKLMHGAMHAAEGHQGGGGPKHEIQVATFKSSVRKIIDAKGK